MDNVIIPSFLSASIRNEPENGAFVALNDYVLRIGTVKRITYPNENGSYSKRSVEYEVEVVYRDSGGGTATSYYQGVISSNSFGSQADYTDATYRIGSRVALMCVNGNQSRALILGGVREQRTETPKYQEKGHHFTFEFNGINFAISENGSAQLFFRGPTKIDGRPQDQAKATEIAGATLRIDPDGSISVFTIDTNGDDEHKIKLDHANGELQISTTGDLKQSADNSINLTAKGLSIEVQGGLDGSGGTAVLDVTENVVIKTPSGLQVIGGLSASDAFLLGTTYRVAESTKNTQLISALGAIAAGATTTATGLGVAAGLNAIPIVGGLLALPGFTTAIVGLTGIASAATTAATAISTFESKGFTYLSSKHFLGD